MSKIKKLRREIKELKQLVATLVECTSEFHCDLSEAFKSINALNERQYDVEQSLRVTEITTSPFNPTWDEFLTQREASIEPSDSGDPERSDKD